VSSGPYIRYWSKGSKTLINFSTPEIFPNIFTPNSPLPSRSNCVITNKPARYVDPKTGKPYADLAAFKKLRERYS